MSDGVSYVRSWDVVVARRIVIIVKKAGIGPMEFVDEHEEGAGC